jgi:hypothetical protein
MHARGLVRMRVGSTTGAGLWPRQVTRQIFDFALGTRRIRTYVSRNEVHLDNMEMLGYERRGQVAWPRWFA